MMQMLHTALVVSVFALVIVSGRAFSFSKRAQIHRFGNDSPTPDECLMPLQQADMERPIGQVLSEHAGVDGYCFFGTLGVWADRCAVARRQQDYFMYAAELGPDYELQSATNALLHKKSGPLNVYYEKGTRALTTDLLNFPFDDVYCDANDWLRLPREKVWNYTFWSALAASECAALMHDNPEFLGLSMRDMITRTLTENDMTKATHKKQGEGPTIKDMKRHAVMKCLVGGLGCDMANCAVNFCRVDMKGNMGHGRRDCAPIPSPVEQL